MSADDRTNSHDFQAMQPRDIDFPRIPNMMLADEIEAAKSVVLTMALNHVCGDSGHLGRAVCGWMALENSRCPSCDGHGTWRIRYASGYVGYATSKRCEAKCDWGRRRLE
jgi:hypothetical protein